MTTSNDWLKRILICKKMIMLPYIFAFQFLIVRLLLDLYCNISFGALYAIIIIRKCINDALTYLHMRSNSQILSHNDNNHCYILLPKLDEIIKKL